MVNNIIKRPKSGNYSYKIGVLRRAYKSGYISKSSYDKGRGRLSRANK